MLPTENLAHSRHATRACCIYTHTCMHAHTQGTAVLALTLTPTPSDQDPGDNTPKEKPLAHCPAQPADGLGCRVLRSPPPSRVGGAAGTHRPKSW